MYEMKGGLVYWLNLVVCEKVVYPIAVDQSLLQNYQDLGKLWATAT
jgi:hypothetical protein